jgi:UDP-glucose 4-epimerase
MRYLVTGGAGFIGSNTVDELVRRGHDVVVLDDLSAGKPANLAEVRSKIQLIQDSITNLDALREACRGVDCVIHLAAQTSVPRSVKDPIETNHINVNGTLNVLVAARETRGICKLLRSLRENLRPSDSRERRHGADFPLRSF